MKVWVVAEGNGEGELRAYSSKKKAQAIEDGLVFGDAPGEGSEEEKPEGKPYVVSDVKKGDPVFVTFLADRGCFYAVGGVFKTEADASANAKTLPADIAALGATGAMSVAELVLE